MKKTFLNELRQHLAQLEENEREEILAFYEERFEIGTSYEGKTEEEIIDELESPAQIAKNVLRSYGYSMKTPVEKGPSTGGMVMVVLFDVLVAIWLVPMLFWLAVNLSITLGQLVFSLPGGATNAGQILSVLAMLSALAIWVLIVLWLYDAFIGFITWLIRWHVRVFGISHKSLMRMLKKFRASYWIKRQGFNRPKNVIKGIAAVTLLVTASSFFIVEGASAIQTGQTLADYEESYVSETPIAIETDLDTGGLDIRRYDGESIVVEKTVHEEADVDISFEDGTLLIENAFDDRFFTFNWLFSLFDHRDAKTTVFIPESLDVEHFDLKATNGTIDVEGFFSTSFKARTSNGAVELTDIESEDVAANSSNGRISLNTITAESIEAETSNGRISLRDSNAETIELRTSNGHITIERINTAENPGASFKTITSNGSIEAFNVYTSEAELKTTNGNIDFENEDRSHRFTTVDYHTTNGNAHVDVPRD